MADNKQNKPNNEEECYASFLSDIQEKMHASIDKAKKHIDNNPNLLSCLLALNSIKDIYDTQAIPLWKEAYSENPSEKILFSASANKAYEMFNELYQYALKKLESHVDISGLGLPKSLEKMTFPENN